MLSQSRDTVVSMGLMSDHLILAVAESKHVVSTLGAGAFGRLQSCQ